MKNVDFDLVIIGGGPAGLAAGLYAARARLKVVLLEKTAPGGQVLITDWIENYPGFPEGLSGFDLIQKLAEQVKNVELKIITDEVLFVDCSKRIKKVQLKDRFILTHTVIIATGAAPSRLGVPGEEKFIGKGVSFCGTCDGPFYKEQIVAAVGGGDTAVKESIFLTRFAKKVYLIHRRDQLRAESILQERAFANKKIEFVWDSVVSQISGSDCVEKIAVKNVNTGETREFEVNGCFIWVGIHPNTKFLRDQVKLDSSGFVITNTNMETSVPGVFAAGDVRNTPLRQVVTAVGDAAIAAFSSQHYVESHT